jgi:hypothetical protein
MTKERGSEIIPPDGFLLKPSLRVGARFAVNMGIRDRRSTVAVSAQSMSGG